MRFVDNQDVPRQTEQAQRRVACRQNRYNRVVDCAGADLREERLAPIVGNPGRISRARWLVCRGGGVVVRIGSRFKNARYETFMQTAARMRQDQRGAGSFREQPPIRIAKPGIHRIGCRHRRQGEE